MWKTRCTSRQGYSKYIPGINCGSPQRIDIHEITNGGRVTRGNATQTIILLHHIRHVHSRQRVISPIETNTGQWHHKGLPHVKSRRVRNRVGIFKLVSGHEATVHRTGYGGEGVGGAGGVFGGDGFSNAVDTGAGYGDFEEERGGEDVVLDVWVGDVDRVGGEEGDGVDLEEGGDLGDLEGGGKGVAEDGGAGVGG